MNCLVDGLDAEYRFSDHLDNPVFATKDQDIHEHWDVRDGPTRYDVKAMKRWSRSNPRPTDRIHFIELRNVKGHLGWVYGDADYIVFETRAYWLVVPRKKLAFFVEEITEKNEHSAIPAVYKLYQRNGRKDLMTVVPTMDLLSLSEKTIKKKTQYE
jgi:hypothetical protein